MRPIADIGDSTAAGDRVGRNSRTCGEFNLVQISQRPREQRSRISYAR